MSLTARSGKLVNVLKKLSYLIFLKIDSVEFHPNSAKSKLDKFSHVC